ncbi:glycosyltransferase family 2 protein [Flavobacteriaceae bacterium GSB9]|nr:glycosyltransferase family 2 protein [Flavobacteriaceae bacterium GSB9]
MLSILIPTYNYNISNLVQEVHQQVCKAHVAFEIICFDDASSIYTEHNKRTIESLAHSRIIISKDNVGRVKARQSLSNQAKFKWLLFLDADVIPKSDTFITDYIKNATSLNYDVFFGGFAYALNLQKKESTLRWKYGRKFEQVDASKRNQSPYSVIISANFLIKKSIFDKINLNFIRKSYGMDNLFAAYLKENNVKVFHLNNEVYHVGVESNKTYLNKVEEAINTLLWAYNHDKMTAHENKLLLTFIKIKKWKLNRFTAFLYRFLKFPIKKNLLGTNPNLYLLQFYKLFYICNKDLNYK